MKLIKTTIVQHPFGLHLRVASSIAKVAQATNSTVTLFHNGQSADAKSIMSILTLQAKKHAEVEIEVVGKDGQVVMERLLEIFRYRPGALL